MGLRELSQKYGKTESARSVNAAIRAEIPGGSLVLDLLTKTHPLRNKDPRWAEQYEILRKIRDEMFNVIAERYGLQSRKETS